MVYNNQITGFTAPIADAVGPFMPYISTKRLCTTGNPRGYYMSSPREVFCWNPNEQKEAHLVERTSYLIVGDIGSGKSAFSKIAMFEDSAIAEDGHPGRGYADNLREIAGKDEYGMLASFMGSEMNAVKRQINPFSADLGFTASDHLATAVSMYESANNGAPPVRNMKLAMRVALAVMLEFDRMGRRHASIEGFADILLNLHQFDAIKHISGVIQAQHRELAQLPDQGDTVEFSRVNQAEFTSPNINWQEFADDAGKVAVAFLNFLDGEYGDTFGGSAPFGVGFGQRFVGLDLAHKPDQVQAFLIEYILRLKDVAARNHDERFKFDIEISDENASLWNYPGFARTMSKRLKYKRGDSTVMYQLTQNLEDYEAVGNTGSTERKLAMNAIRDFGAIVYGRLESPSSLAYAAQVSNLTPLEQSIIKRLNPGQYGIKFPGEPVQFVQVSMNPVRRHLIETNAAVIEAIRRRRNYALGR